MTSDSQTSSALNERRRLAVKLRLEGRKLKDIVKLVDLSSPTVIAAHKQFLNGGWEAVDVKPRGRPSGDRTASVESMEQLRKAAFGQPPSGEALWTNDALAGEAKKLGIEASSRTVGKYVEEWDLSSTSQYRACKSDEQYKDWMATAYKTITNAARKQDATISGQDQPPAPPAGKTVFKNICMRTQPKAGTSGWQVSTGLTLIDSSTFLPGCLQTNQSLLSSGTATTRT